MQRVRRISTALLAAVAMVSTLSVASASCASCRYAAWNCSSTVATTETSVANTEQTSELRKGAQAVTEVQPIQVCDAMGKIQVDDVFCDTSNCECVDGKRCVSMVLGCQSIFQARSRKRCIGDQAIQHRFSKCAAEQRLTKQRTANLDKDWVYFKDHHLCKSADCLAVQRFHECGAVQCGYLVVAWKESAHEYRFVVDGSRASDMAAGTFLFSATMKNRDRCPTFKSSAIENCYSFQTRNQKGENCDGIYLQADMRLQAASEKYSLSVLPWGVWLAVVGSVAVAVASIASVLVVVYRHRRERQEDELNGLLPAECITPTITASSLQNGATPQTKGEVRMRAPVPQSNTMK